MVPGRPTEQFQKKHPIHGYCEVKKDEKKYLTQGYGELQGFGDLGKNISEVWWQ